MNGNSILTMFVSTALVALVLPALGPPTAYAAEYNETGTTCWSGTSNVVVRGKGDVAMSFVMHGAVIRDNPKSPFHKGSFKCVGAGTLVKGKFTGPVYCQAVTKNGDKVFATCGGGKCTYTSGTGKLAGIKGGWTSKMIGPFPSPARGVFVNCNKSSYKFTIPD